MNDKKIELQQKLETEKKERTKRRDEIIRFKERMELTSKSLLDLTFESCKLKLECFLKSFLLSASIYLIVMLFMEKNFGLINQIATLTNTNEFFLSIAFGNIFSFSAFLINFYHFRSFPFLHL